MRRVRCLFAAMALLMCASGAHAAPLYTFVSAPDTWNADIGQVPSPPPNSLNADWTRAIDAILTRFSSYHPAFVLMAGDAVNGHWYMDPGALGAATATQAVRTGAAIYYPQWLASFTAHGLVVHPALGDHDLGDNPWRTRERRALVPVYRRAWTGVFGRTSYAFRHGPVEFVTVDEFHQRADGSIVLEVAGAQLRWLARVLGRANRDPAVHWIIVQGHLPVQAPATSFHSSDLTLAAGPWGPFWQTLVTHHVDAYLAGEWHVFDDANVRGVEQITHGTVLGWAAFNYLEVEVYRRHLFVNSYVAHVRERSHTHLWQVGNRWPLAHPVIDGFSLAGSMAIDRSGHRTDRSGVFFNSA